MRFVKATTACRVPVADSPLNEMEERRLLIGAKADSTISSATEGTTKPASTNTPRSRSMANHHECAALNSVVAQAGGL